jgi:hypothetical protein
MYLCVRLFMVLFTRNICEYNWDGCLVFNLSFGQALMYILSPGGRFKYPYHGTASRRRRGVSNLAMSPAELGPYNGSHYEGQQQL